MDAESSSSIVIVAFDATTKESLSQAGIIFAMEQLKRGDTLMIFSVWESKLRLVADDADIWKKVKTSWRSLPPGLEQRCVKASVELVVTVNSAPRGEVELAVCREATQVRASHVVLDKSLKSKNRRHFFAMNLACAVTRMRKSGGVDTIRGPGPRAHVPISVPWFPPRLLSYDDQVDEFTFPLAEGRLTAVVGAVPARTIPKLPSSEETLASSVSTSTALVCEHRSSESSVNRPSFASASHADGHDLDDDYEEDDLFSICHGSSRHRGIATDGKCNSSNTNPGSNPGLLGYESGSDLFSIDSDLFSLRIIASSSFPGYESDDLFSINAASASQAP